MKYVVLFSGGQDSTTCLYWVLSQAKPDDVVCVFFDYGQQHLNAEWESAKAISRMVGVGLKRSELYWSVNSDLTTKGKKINQESGKLPSSFVPGRNLMMLTAAASLTYEYKPEFLVIGANAVDYSGYPDCRPESILSFQDAINAAMESKINILAPLIHKTKEEISKMGINLGAKEALAKSHTCYYGQTPPCGECPSCVIRAKGFELAGIGDPLIEGIK